MNSNFVKIVAVYGIFDLNISSTWAIYVETFKRVITRPHLKSAASTNLLSSAKTRKKFIRFYGRKIIIDNTVFERMQRNLHTQNE